MLAAKKHAVATRTNAGGDSTIYPDIAREVLIAYPAITIVEKATMLGTFQHDAESYAPLHMTAGLREAARILGI
jgi:hypothetical protein